MEGIVCVHCGANNSSIYKQFSNEIIKLTKCEKCDNFVDEYVETEYSIIVIDMLLLRKEALRHVLFNSNLKVAWKLIVLYILCDAYEKMASQKHFWNKSYKSDIFINELELNFYFMCIKSFLEYFIFATLTVVILYHSQEKGAKRFSSKNLFNSIVLASYGKLFMLPVLVWSKDDEYCEILIILFIFLSQLQVIRVTTKLSNLFIAIILIVISEIGYLLLQYII
ncbi:protein ARV1-like isoform X1 [Argiope bruennichi]|uniref:protein ARV1-like isoform X1 n=2 Tax=Argiope bruennichi TaxID=94029 RepID=UPI00249427CF|nr:protein ARV1-like isoform X1 [Argiope bruennichi]